MAQKSRIEQELNETDLAEFRRLLATGRLTIDGLVTWLQGRGYDISRSSVGRFQQRFEEEARAIRESREIVQALAVELGESEIQGQHGRLLVEMARTLTHDFLVKVRQEGGTVSPKDIAMLGKGLAEMAKALRLDQDFEIKVEQVRKAAREEAAREAAKRLDAAEAEARAAGEKGLSPERLAQLRRDFLGVKPAGGGDG